MFFVPFVHFFLSKNGVVGEVDVLITNPSNLVYDYVLDEETTGLGAAFAAGLAVGVWADVEEVGKLWKSDMLWQPKMVNSERERCWKGWNKAVKKSLNWLDDDD